ncbi:response regulator [uncultured Amnibacterium sp.]|uniref:response regulator n=1 Tax=uncultured Amnibacterium sp. TaxID=1631851 RepID=UPI0035CC3074
MIRVVIVDDQHLVRAGLRVLVDAEDDLTVVGDAADGRQGLAVCARTHPDVVLMDIRMPVLDGVEATALLRARDDGPRVIVLTTFDTDELVFAALRAGASGFVLKDIPADDLFAAIRTVAAGSAMLAPAITARLIAHFVLTAPRRPVASSTEASSEGSGAGSSAVALLTPREREVLTSVARGRSNPEIAADLFLSEATVKTHIGRVFEKLGVRDRAQAVIAAYESGVVTPST